MSDPSEPGMPVDKRWLADGLTLEWFAEKAEWLDRDSHSPGAPSRSWIGQVIISPNGSKIRPPSTPRMEFLK
jgi:hypothetical protein